jgi:hypothetical protein
MAADSTHAARLPPMYARATAAKARTKSVRGLTIAAVDIQLLMRWSPLRACAPVVAPLMFWSAAERD